MKPDAEWVRLEESWTAATEMPWRFEQEQEPPVDLAWFAVAGAAVALVALAVWVWTR